MRRSISILALAVLTVAAFALAGCGSTELEPASRAQQIETLEDAAVDTLNGIRVVVRADAWDRPTAIETEVTPLRVTIDNDGDEPVRLRYSEFALVGPEGQRYSALPPFGLEGTVEEPVLATDYTPIYDPGFVGDSFYVAPYYTPIYPSLTAYSGLFPFDSLYYQRYHRIWLDKQLPTGEMLAEALPEGVIEPGGEVSGFLYFERVPREIDRVHLRGDLINPESGEILGSVQIPFLATESL